eukprot:4738728-Karenia_brevis.AAC.1
MNDDKTAPPSIPISSVISEAQGLAFCTKETFKTVSAVRSSHPLAVLLPSHLGLEVKAMGINDSA